MKHCIMDENCAELRRALLDNSNYSEVSQATQKLGQAVSHVKAIHTSGSGVCFDATLFAEAKSALGLGIETVSITYVLFRIEKEVSAERSVFKRRALCKELRAALDAKGVAFGASIDAHVERLCAA